MSDFEVLISGSIRELQLSRNLSREIQKTLNDPNFDSSLIPEGILNAFRQLKEHYENLDWTI